MEKLIAPSCAKCGKRPEYLTSMLDPKVGRTFYMFRCECGEQSWISEKKVVGLDK